MRRYYCVHVLFVYVVKWARICELQIMIIMGERGSEMRHLINKVNSKFTGHRHLESIVQVAPLNSTPGIGSWKVSDGLLVDANMNTLKLFDGKIVIILHTNN